MADNIICSSETQPNDNTVLPELSFPLNKCYLPRTIGFHLAKKPFLGFSNGGSSFKLEILNPTSEPSSSSAIQGYTSGKKSDVPEIFENMLDSELNSGEKVRKIGAGLQNLGNTCFLNSVLQCLTYTEPLAAYLRSGKHQLSCHIAGFCALCAIQKHVSRALESTGRILAPKDFVLNLRCISRSFSNARQEDAHEYMVNLLESMHKCSLPSGVSSDTPSAYDKSLVHKIFGGYLRSQVKCLQCSNCTNKFDPFLDLSLEIVDAESLNKALMHFTAPEQLDGGERQYQCHRCLQKVKALKQMTVYKAPYVLTVHLKRFTSHDPGRKIDKKIHFDPTLDLKPFCSGSNEGELKYTLYGVLVHAGWSTRSGHYYCFVRTSTGMWYSLDDNRVIQVNERTVLQQKAYMVFYVRDRKNVTSKNPIDVPKGNLGSNSVLNKCCSNTVQAPKDAVPPGKTAEDSAITVIPPKDAIILGPLTELLSNQAPDKNIHCLVKDSPPMEEPALQDVEKTSGKIITDSSSIIADEHVLMNGPLLSTINGIQNSGTERLISEEISSRADCIVPESGADGNFIKNTDAEIPKIRSPLICESRSLDVIKSRAHRRPVKFKKALKFRATSMHLASTIFLNAFLTIKKWKNNKRYRSALQNSVTDMDPSTSEKTRTAFHQRKRLKSSTCDLANGCGAGNEELDPCVGAPASRMALNQWGNDERDCIHGLKKCSLQNGSRDASVSGLAHRTVKQWDDDEKSSLPSEMLEHDSEGHGNIGYVLDEWGEDYDRGKQKKVRELKRKFDGQNPFQEIASKKAHKKMQQRHNWGHQPLRI